MLNLHVGLEVGAQGNTSRVAQVQDRKATWARLNFIDFSGNGWTDPALLAQYDAIVDAYVAAGIEIIGLIGAESVSTGYDRNNPGAFTTPFRTQAEHILRHFGDRLRFLEVFNEPNDWNGGTSAQVPAKNLAAYLDAVYQAQDKLIHAGFAQKVQLLVGPLFSFDGDTGADYLNLAFHEGVTKFGWSPTAYYPLAGLAYHIYVVQGPSPVSMADIVAAIQKNLTAVENILSHYQAEVAIYITECGWQTNTDHLTPTQQADALETAMDTFAADPAVKVAMWFSIQDHPQTGDWGLLDQNGNPKLSWDRFRTMALKYP